MHYFNSSGTVHLGVDKPSRYVLHSWLCMRLLKDLRSSQTLIINKGISLKKKKYYTILSKNVFLVFKTYYRMIP